MIEKIRQLRIFILAVGCGAVVLSGFLCGCASPGQDEPDEVQKLVDQLAYHPLGTTDFHTLGDITTEINGVTYFSAPLPYDAVRIIGDLDRLEYKQLADAVDKHHPFLLPGRASQAAQAIEWYTAAIIQVQLTTADQADVLTSFGGRFGGSGNWIEMKKKSGTWRVLKVKTWAK